MNHFRNVLFALFIIGSLMGVQACDSDGPAEQAGEKVDESMEKAGDKLEKAGDNVQDAVN